MVYVEITGEKDGVFTASYTPERKDAPRGEIALDAKTGSRNILSRSPDDTMPVTWYIGHAFRELERMVKESPVRTTGMSAWY